MVLRWRKPIGVDEITKVIDDIETFDVPTNTFYDRERLSSSKERLGRVTAIEDPRRRTFALSQLHADLLVQLSDLKTSITRCDPVVRRHRTIVIAAQVELTIAILHLSLFTTILLFASHPLDVELMFFPSELADIPAPLPAIAFVVPFAILALTDLVFVARPGKSISAAIFVGLWAFSLAMGRLALIAGSVIVVQPAWTTSDLILTVVFGFECFLCGVRVIPVTICSAGRIAIMRGCRRARLIAGSPTGADARETVPDSG